MVNVLFANGSDWCIMDYLVFTFPEWMLKERSLNTWKSGLVGYLKLTWWNSISPSKCSNIIPESSLGSIFDFPSRIANIEPTELFALLESGANELNWEIPNAANVRAKKTYKITKCIPIMCSIYPYIPP